MLKIDIEGCEYDAVHDAYSMCERGELSVDQLLVELHVGGAIKSCRDDHHRYEYTLRQLSEIFSKASSCNLMLHHRERNSWGCAGFWCSEFSWVSVRHARRTFEHTFADVPNRRSIA